MAKKTQSSSEQYIYWCVDVIKADKNISEDTIIIMFVQYGKKLLKEKANGTK